MSATSTIAYTKTALPNGQQITTASSFEPSTAAVQAVAAARELLASRPDRDLAGFLAAAGDSIGSTVFGHCAVGVPGGASLTKGASLDVASALDPLLIVLSKPRADASPFVLGGPIEGDEGVRIAIDLVTAFVIPVPRDQLRPTEVPASEFIACTPNDDSWTPSFGAPGQWTYKRTGPNGSGLYQPAALERGWQVRSVGLLPTEYCHEWVKNPEYTPATLVQGKRRPKYTRAAQCPGRRRRCRRL